MVITRDSNEDEMVLEFLSMEIKSERFAQDILNVLDELKIDKSIILHGDIKNRDENKLRRKILGRFRGYRENRELFANFPNNIAWKWTVFNKTDLPKIKYITYSYWDEISNYTGSPLEAAKTIKSGKTVFDVPNDGFLNALESLKNGVKFPPLIMLTDPGEEAYIVLEGHKRITAYCLDTELFKDVSVLLGYCSAAELKNWYGEMSVPF